MQRLVAPMEGKGWSDGTELTAGDCMARHGIDLGWVGAQLGSLYCPANVPPLGLEEPILEAVLGVAVLLRLPPKLQL